MRNGLVVLDDVLIERRTDAGWHCDVPSHPRVRVLTVAHIAPATPMPSEGTRGRVVITAAAAHELGIGARRSG